MRSSNAILLLAFACTAATAEDRIFVELPARMDAAARVDPDVKEECDLPVLVGRQVLAKVYERNPGAMALDGSAPASTRFIRVRIVSATTMPGVGMRQIYGAAEVVQDDKVVASTRINGRTSATPGMGMRLCDVMDHIAEFIGKRVSTWAEVAYPPKPQ